MKFLIIRFSSIGDVVLTTPVVRCLKQQVPDAEVHYFIKDEYKEIMLSNPYVDKVHVLKYDLNRVLPDLEKEKFDYIIDLHHNLRSLAVKRALKKVPARSFNKLNIQKWLLTALKINMMPDVHIVDRYLQTVKTFGVVNDGRGLDYFIPDKDKVPDSDIPAALSLGYIGLVIGAAHTTKKLPVEKIKELCLKIDHPIMLLGGPEDRQTGNDIASYDTIKIYNSCGKFNLNESADLIRRSRFIITHDTGLMHIAAAFKKPVISVWGNTVPSFGLSQYYGNTMVQNSVMEVKSLWCRPCSKIGYSRCPLGHFKCMNRQDIDKLTMQVKASIQK